MLVLALDTSSPATSVALVDVASMTTAAEASTVGDNRHGELLAPLVGEVLSAAGVARGRLDAVAVGLGPGPFTGLRVGVVSAAALADAWRVPAYGVCSLDVVAEAFAAAGRRFAVVTDARRRQVYWASYDERGRRLHGPGVDRPEDLAASLDGRVSALVGPGAVRYAELFAAFTLADAHPEARQVAALAADRVRGHAPGEPLEPLYLRRPDARPPGPPKQVTRA